MTRTSRAATALGAALALAGLLGGCGIQATSVPVDAGAAPTRVACALPSPQPSSGVTYGTTTVEVYLVCSQRVSPVQRRVRERRPDRVGTAGMLLDELERKPDDPEIDAGFSSEVPRGLTVSGPAFGDPAGALRLGQDPRDLPSYAVGQLVCTFADSLEGTIDGFVVLGGPDPRVPARRYECDDTLRTSPDAGPTAGLPLH